MKTEKATISEGLSKLLNEQIKKEMESAYLYLQIAHYFEKNELIGFANWFKIQSKEEQEHAVKIYDYLMSNNAPVIFYDIKPSSLDFHSFKEPLEKSLLHEKFVTDSINTIYKLSELEHDFRTQKFLDWFILEQLEEEINAQNLLDSYEVFVENGSACDCSCALFELDKKFGQRMKSVKA